MSKTFDLTPVFGPAVSVRHHGSPRVQARGQIRAVPVYTLLALLGIVLVSYVFLINGSAAKGYEMKKIQNRIQQQSEARHSLEIKASELASLGAIDKAAENASLVAVKSEEFLTPTAITALKTDK